MILICGLTLSIELWSDDAFITINESLNRLELEPDYEGKQLDIQYFLTKKCAGAYQVLLQIEEEDFEEMTSKFINASIGLRMMIGGNKPEGLDKSIDEITLEVNADIDDLKDGYENHLVTWYESAERNPEAIFSKPFAEDLSICMSIADGMSKSK